MCIQDGKELPKLGEAEVQELPDNGILVGSDPQIEDPVKDYSTKKNTLGVNGQEIKCKICYQDLSKKASVVFCCIFVVFLYFFYNDSASSQNIWNCRCTLDWIK